MWLSINVNKIDTFRKTLKEFIEQAASKSLSAVDNNHSPRRFFVVTSSRMISRGDAVPWKRTSSHRGTSAGKFIRSKLSQSRDEAIYMDVLSVTVPRYTFVSFERSTGCFNGVLSHALEVFIRASGRLVPAQSEVWAISQRPPRLFHSFLHSRSHSSETTL